MYEVEIERNRLSSKGGSEKIKVDAEHWQLDTNSDMINFEKGDEVVFSTQQFRVISIRVVEATN